MGDIPEGFYKLKSIQIGAYAENWPDNSPGIGIGPYFPGRRRDVWEIRRKGPPNNAYTIKSVGDGTDVGFFRRDTNPYLLSTRDSPGATWIIENNGSHVKFYPNDRGYRSLAVGLFPGGGYRYLGAIRPNANPASQEWAFERVDEFGNPFTQGTTNTGESTSSNSGTTTQGGNQGTNSGNQGTNSSSSTTHGNQGTSGTNSGTNQQETGKPVVNTSPSGPNFERQFFPLTAEDVKNTTFDIIIVGTGFGGGVLAGDLFDTNSKLGDGAKSILVIERGGLVFHSHCLNTARPMGLGKDRGQQNDTFFANFKKDYTFSDEESKKQWKGGPMHSLGGRSAAWGLFAPRTHDDTLRDFFPDIIKQELLGEYFEKAEDLMNLSMPETRPIHQHLMERMNMATESRTRTLVGPDIARRLPPTLRLQWQWGRIASEFRQNQNFDFAQGAYSPIDKLLEIAMSKPKDTAGRTVEHKNFKFLLNAEVRRLTWVKDGSVGDYVKGVMVRTSSGDHEIKVTPGTGRVVVCAGSVASPTILMRSGIPVREMGGCRLTDHDILYRAKSFRYLNPAIRKEVGSMKLQTYVDLGGNICLINMSVDASSFLPRGQPRDNTIPRMIIVFMMRAPLKKENNITLVNDEPVVTIRRSNVREFPKQEAEDEVKMNAITQATMETMQKVLQIEWVDQEGEPKTFSKLELGGVAHELGTVPMPMSEDDQRPACLDTNLALRGRGGVYVCDLSIFPYSPEANPTPTLAGLSLRLSRHLLRRHNLKEASIAGNTVCIVNHSGEKFRVFVSNRAGVANDPNAKGTELDPGQTARWERKSGIAEAALVYRVDQLESWKYVQAPELFVAEPGKLLPVM